MRIDIHFSFLRRAVPIGNNKKCVSECLKYHFICFAIINLNDELLFSLKIYIFPGQIRHISLYEYNWLARSR